jgi:pilus assembly protein CpaC
VIDKRLTEVASKITGLGDIPVLGKLFRSRSKQRSDTELLVIVTPTLVQPTSAGERVPGHPALELEKLPPLDKEKEKEKEKGEDKGEEQEKGEQKDDGAQADTQPEPPEGLEPPMGEWM